VIFREISLWYNEWKTENTPITIKKWKKNENIQAIDDIIVKIFDDIDRIINKMITINDNVERYRKFNQKWWASEQWSRFQM
jgi:archaellum component FlaC